MRKMITTLATVLLLAVGLGAAVEHDTLICYGDEVETVIGGSTESTNVNYHCPSCKQATLCPQGTNLCFQLTAQYIHVFQGGYVSQPPIALPQDCQPLRIVEFDPGFEYIVQCASTPPLYNPARQHIFRQNEEFILDREIREENADETLASDPDNNVLIIHYSELYIVSFYSNVILGHYYENYRTTITECSNITKLTAGPVVDDNFQFIVDCVDKNGIFATKRVLIADNLETLLSVEPLPSSRLSTNDDISFSPDGLYILDVSSSETISQLVIVQVNDIAGVPGILSGKPIAQAVFITSDIILVSIPGNEFELINIPQLFSTSFEAGRYELPGSEVICPQGKCAPVVFSNGTLYVFSADGSYQLLLAYDINNPSASPKRINRVQRTAMYDVCFEVNANISVLDPPTPPPTPPTIVKPSVIVGGIKPFHSPILNEGQIAGIVIGGIVVAIIVLSAIISILILKKITKRLKPPSRVAQAQPDIEQPSSTGTSMLSLTYSATSSRSVTPMPPVIHVTPVKPSQETVIVHKHVPLASHSTEQQVPPKP